MNKEPILDKIQHQHPRLVYLSGKTCTGKTAFANHLEQYGYKKVELDKIVMDSVVTPFGVAAGDGFRTAYRDEGSAEQVGAFINAAKVEILKKVQESPLVIEGAVASSRILGEIFSDDLKNFVFIYFHPIHAEVYERHILSRFVAGAKKGTAGLPKDFWELVQPSDLEDFKVSDEVNPGVHTAIKTYAGKSMEESKFRLEHFRGSFTDIAVIEV